MCSIINQNGTANRESTAWRSYIEQQQQQHEQQKIVSKKTELQNIQEKKNTKETKASNKSVNTFDSVTN